MAFESEPRRAEVREEHEEQEASPAMIDPNDLLRAGAEFAKENPHAALGAAFAIGYILGGGLTPRLLASVAVFAGRRYLAQAARDALGEQIEGALKGSAP